MKVEDLILQLQDVISAAKSMPFSGGKVMVSSDEIYDILDQIQDAMPAEVRQAKNIVADRKQILAEEQIGNGHGDAMGGAIIGKKEYLDIISIAGAMSYGSISQEAHETLAIAMNQQRGRR